MSRTSPRFNTKPSFKNPPKKASASSDVIFKMLPESWDFHSEFDSFSQNTASVLKFTRIKEVLTRLGFSDQCILFPNFFTSSRLDSWIRKNTRWHSMGGECSLSMKYPVKDPLSYDIMPMIGIAELSKGVYLFEYTESNIEEFQNRRYIVFDKKEHAWGAEEIRKFTLDFSKKIFTCYNQDRDDGDPHAFDSLFLPDSLFLDIKEDIEAFLQSRRMYKEDLNLAWKRGYMLIGPPGNGKTLLIRKICEYYGLEHFDIKAALTQDGSLNMDQAMEGTVDMHLYPDENRPKVCVLEDIDKFTAFQGGEADGKDFAAVSLHSLLKGLDGVDQYDGVILIATSNFPDVLHEALVGRPGRFDKIYEVEKPLPEAILRFLNYYKISVKGGSLDHVADQLKGSSMAFVAEFVKSAKMKYKRNEITPEEVKVLIDAIKQHQKLCEHHFKEERKVGFSNGRIPSTQK